MNKQAFTLIELLVVVLIIGILAAVALPQYQKAVRKSQLVQGLVFAKAVHEAQEVYFLANGKFATSQEELDLQITCPEKLSCSITAQKTDINISSKGGYQLLDIIYHNDTFYSEDKKWSKALYCWAATRDPQAVEICKSMGTLLSESDIEVRYRLN